MILNIQGPSDLFDLLKPFTGEEQRILFHFGNPAYWRWVRAAGFFNEPSTYALFSSVFYLLHVWTRRKSENLHSAVTGIYLISLFFSFSLTGWFGGGVVLIMLLMTEKFSSRHLRDAILFCVATLALSLIMSSELRRMTFLTCMRGVSFFGDASFQSRFAAYPVQDVPVTIGRPAAPPISGFWGAVLGRGVGNLSDPTGNGLYYFIKYFGLLALPWCWFLLNRRANAAVATTFCLFLWNAPYVQHPIFFLALAALRDDARPRGE